MAIAAAVPAFNEEATIEAIVAGLLPQVDRVVVVDDGSCDCTAAYAARAGAELVPHRNNLGKGTAIRTALAWARDHPEVSELVLLDGDGQHDPSDVARLIRERRELGVDLLVGSRFLGTNNAPLYRLFGLHVLSAAAALGSGIRLTDSQSGFRVLSRPAIDQLELHERSFAVEAEMQYEASTKGLSMSETPIHIGYAGQARRSPIVHGVSVLIRTILMTARRRPARLPALVAIPAVAIHIARTSRQPTEDRMLKRQSRGRSA
jgi:glycosyltransferase involved in cell wall biosynthesis